MEKPMLEPIRMAESKPILKIGNGKQGKDKVIIIIVVVIIIIAVVIIIIIIIISNNDDDKQ